MLRRVFLRRLSLTAAGLMVADDALELLTHRKVWAGHSFEGDVYGRSYLELMDADRLQKAIINSVVRESEIAALFRKRGPAVGGFRLETAPLFRV